MARPVGKPEMNLGVSTIFASSPGFCSELCRVRRCGAMASMVWRSEPTQRQCPSEQRTHAGKGGDGEKGGAERLADLSMNGSLARRGKARQDVGSLFDDAAEQACRAAVGR